MDIVEVEITGQVMTARYGTLNTGDILKTDAAFAAHLVDDCGGAKYRTVVSAPSGAAPDAGEALKPAKPKKAGASKAAAPAPVVPPPVEVVEEIVVPPLVEAAEVTDVLPVADTGAAPVVDLAGEQ